jgi:hypothetical protein
MKKIFLIAAALLVISSAAFAGALDIFTNSTHDAWCAYPLPSVPYQPVDVYFFARPPADGFRATECKMVLPDPALSIVNTVYHPLMNLAFGDWATGMSLSFSGCISADWTLCATISLLAFPPGVGPDCQVIELLPRDDSGFFGFATCATGYPPEAAYHAYDVYLNCEPCPDIVATKDSSWGAIKNLYSE